MFFWFIPGGTSYRMEGRCSSLRSDRGGWSWPNRKPLKVPPFFKKSVQVLRHQNGKGFDKQKRGYMPESTVHLEDHSQLGKS